MAKNGLPTIQLKLTIGTIMMESAKMMERCTFSVDLVPLEMSCGRFKMIL